MYKEIFENKKVIIFDMDGTIVDTGKQWEDALYRVLKNLGVTWVDTAKVLETGKTQAAVWDYILEKCDTGIKSSVAEMVSATENKFIEIVREQGLVVTDGFYEVIAEMKLDYNKKTALVSNTSRHVIDFMIKQLELDEAFDFTVTVTEVKKPKPAPDMYNKVLEFFKIKPEEAITFEDSVIGSEAASKAHVDQIIIWNTDTPQNLYHDNIFMFTQDFRSFYGALDKTAYEAYKDEYEQLKKDQSPTSIS